MQTKKYNHARISNHISVITKPLSNIYEEGELSKEATCAKLAQVQQEGNRQVSRELDFYNLDAKIAGGIRL